MTMQINATPILRHDKTTQNLSRGNINDSCRDGMIIGYITSQQTQASSLFEFHTAIHTG